MNAPIPSRADLVPPDPTPDTRMNEALALRHEAMRLSAQLDYFRRHELADMRAKAAYFSFLSHLSDCRVADRMAQRRTRR